MKKKSLLDRITYLVARFLGSWWAVVLHTFWFIVWIILRFDLSLLILWVSLEAIFIGIFLLMASNKAEIERDRREATEQARQAERIQFNTALNETQNAVLAELRRSSKEIKEELMEVREALRKTQSKVIKLEANSK